MDFWNWMCDRHHKKHSNWKQYTHVHFFEPLESRILLSADLTPYHAPLCLVESSCISVDADIRDCLPQETEGLDVHQAEVSAGLTNWTQIGSDIDGEAAYDRSGRSVAMSADGNIVIIGAPHNGGNGRDAGHAWVYELVGGTWVQKGSDIDGEAVGDYCGISVDMSADGNTIIIGASRNNGNGSNSGHARVYEFSDGVWVQKGPDIDGEAAGDEFGFSVAMSADGNCVVIGAPGNDGNGSNSGHVRVYEFRGASWVQKGADINGEAADDNAGWSGFSVAMSDDGNSVIIGAWENDGNGSNSGHARVYEFSSGTWTQKGSDIDGEAAHDGFGHSVAMSADGTSVIIGARYNDDNGFSSGHARVYEFSGGTWTQKGFDIDGEAADDESGFSVAMSADGSRVIIGAWGNDGNDSDSGHARIYEFSGDTWIQVGDDIDGEAFGDWFGFSVATNVDGSRVIIGAYHNDGNGRQSGHARVYTSALGEAPIITSDGGGGIAIINVPENTAIVTDVQSADDNDSEGSGLLYSLTGGGDQALFEVDTHTGLLSFKLAPDFENPVDLNTGNNYEVQVTVTDSYGLTDKQDILVNVTDVNEYLPTIAVDSPTVTVHEGSLAQNSGTFEDRDPGDVVTIAASVGEILQAGTQAGTWIWMYSPSEGPNSQPIVVTATDSEGASETISFELVVTNTAPVLSSFTHDATFANPGEEGVAGWITASYQDDGVEDTHSAFIDWGDGSSSEGIVDQGTITASHVYQVGGIYSLKLMLTDDDGDTDEAVTQAVIQGVGLHDGQLQVIGSTGHDYVQLNMLSGNEFRPTEITVFADFLPVGAKNRTYLKRDIDSMVMILNDGNDHVIVSGRVKRPMIIDGGAGDDNLMGGYDDDILLGGSGSDILHGSRGRDILIGGGGNDTLLGGYGQDILISGYTLFGSQASPTGIPDLTALRSIKAEWNSSRSNTKRRNNLSNSDPTFDRLNGEYFLIPGVTVFDDGELDTLLGGRGNDWLWD